MPKRVRRVKFERVSNKGSTSMSESVTTADDEEVFSDALPDAALERAV
jgi:hypothetical protein